MAFKMKGINSLTNNSLSKQVKRGSSPLFETDPSFKEMSEEIEITDSVKDLQGKDFATGRTITTDPTKDVEKIETNNEKFLASFNNEYKKAQEGGFAGTLPEYIKQKEEKLGYKGKKINQVRDYSVEKKSEYKIDKKTGKSYITKPYGNSGKIFKREYHYPGYNTGHHPKGHLVSENEMLGNLYERFPTKTYGKKAQKIYANWIKSNTGRDVSWGSGSYSRNKKTNNSESENKGDWKNDN